MDLEKVDFLTEIDSLRRGWQACQARLAAVEAERDAARAGEVRAVEALKRIADICRPETQGNTSEGLLAHACIMSLETAECALSEQPALAWLAQQRREAAAEAAEALEGIGAKQTSASGPAAQKVETLIFLADIADKLARLDCELIDRAAMAQRAALFRECAAMMRERDAARAKRDAALAEVAHMKREQQAMIMQHRHDIRDLGQLLQDERCKVATIEAAWYAAQAGEARAVEALMRCHEGAARQLTEPRVHDDDLYALAVIATDCEAVLEAQGPALDWLAQQRREAVASWIEKEATKCRQQDGEYYERGVDCMLREAAALRAGEVGNE